MLPIFQKKPLSALTESDRRHELKKTLTLWHLIALGIGAIIGAGLFVSTAIATQENAGAGVIFSFLLAGAACIFAALCFAEISGIIPSSGSSYAYTYVAMGELFAWLVGAALIQQYVLAAATCGAAASSYLNFLLGNTLPYEWCHPPFDADANGIHGILNIPAILLIGLIALLLIRGTSGSAAFNNIMVVVKILIITGFIGLGFFSDSMLADNHSQFYIPSPESGKTFWNTLDATHGLGGILAGAGVVVFSLLGFDVIATASEETKNAKRNIPLAIILSLLICTALYLMFSYVFTGLVNAEELKTIGSNKDAAVAYAFGKLNIAWLTKAASIGIFVSFLTVLVGAIYGQSRVLLVIAKDKLLPSALTRIHPAFKTPVTATLFAFLASALLAGLLPISLLGSLSSFGTLCSYLVVCLCVLILRKTHKNIHRPFKIPFMPVIPVLGMLFCGILLFSFQPRIQIITLIWFTAATVFYLIRLYLQKKKAKQ